MDRQQFKKALPSRKFVFVIGAVAAIVLVALAASAHFGSRVFFKKDAGVSETGDTTVGQLVTLDSNDNGIPDWEESLWGLDPKGDGAKNKLIIDQKMAAANVTPPDETATAAADDGTPTAAFARQLLSTILSLNQSGDLNADSLAQINTTLDADVDAHRVTAPAYATTDMHIIDDTSPAAEALYESQFKAATLKYTDSGMGTEFDVLAMVLDDPDANNEALAIQEITPIAAAYVAYSKDIMALDTPVDAAPLALALANASALTGVSLSQTETIYTDAVTGMVGIDNYVDTIDPLNQASSDMIAFFSKQS